MESRITPCDVSFVMLSQSEAFQLTPHCFLTIRQFTVHVHAQVLMPCALISLYNLLHRILSRTFCKSTYTTSEGIFESHLLYIWLKNSMKFAKHYVLLQSVCWFSVNNLLTSIKCSTLSLISVYKFFLKPKQDK